MSINFVYFLPLDKSIELKFYLYMAFPFAMLILLTFEYKQIIYTYYLLSGKDWKRTFAKIFMYILVLEGLVSLLQ